jgi:acetyltransferase-like isoleucine patch superfamily enzyme
MITTCPCPTTASDRRRPDHEACRSPVTRTTSDAGFDRRGSGHGMLNAHQVGNRWRIAIRHIALTLLGKLPGTRFKSRLFARLFRIRMGRDVGLACNVLLDPYAPSMISFGDNVIVGYDSKIFVHVFTLDHQRVRPVRIGSNVLIGAFCVIAPGVTIGDGASIAPGTYVTRNVPAGAIVTGHAMRIRRRSSRG